VSSSDESGEAVAFADELQAGLELGATIDGRYRVVGRIGCGGMGEVVEVEHLRLGRTFALKALRPELCRQRKVAQRFRTEWAAMAAIRSEHVVTIVDTGSLPSGVPYFVMERLAGEDLRSVLGHGGRLPPVRVAELGIDACYGLAALHSAGLVHRDLKPENLFVTSGDDGRDVVKLLDLGVAKVLGENATAPGSVIGTARYMAPEQVGEDGAVGPPADIFALGVILYEALAGRVPFDGDTFERVVFKIMTTTPDSLAQTCPEAPPALVEAVERALSKSPAGRYPSAVAFAATLAQAVDSARGRVGGRSPSVGVRVRPARHDTTLDESFGSEGPRASTPSAHVTGARGVPRASRLGVGLAVAASIAVIVAFAAFRPSTSPEERVASPPTVVSVRPAAVAPPSPPEPVPASSVSGTGALGPPARPDSSAQPATSSSSSPSLRRLRTSAPAKSPAGGAPRVAFDPENPYGK
jgi:serine/threonine protein kinase